VAAAIGPEMGLDAGLRRPVVVRAQRQDAGDAELRGLLGEVHRVGRVVRAGAGDDRDRDGLGDGGPQDSFSSSVSTGLSPVVPATTKPSFPLATR
jgi:hypothetical protein